MSKSYNNRKATLKKVKGIKPLALLSGKRSNLPAEQKKQRDKLILTVTQGIKEERK